LAEIDDEVLRSHYIQRLARELGVADEAIWEKVGSSVVSGSAAVERKTLSLKGEELPRRGETLMHYFFSVCFQHKKEKLLIDRELAELVVLPAHKRLIRFLKKYFDKNKKFVSRQFAQSLPPELQEIFNEFYLDPLANKIADKGELEKEIEKIKEELKLAYYRQEITRLSKEVVLREKEGKDEEVAALQLKINKLLKQIAPSAIANTK